MRPFYHLPFPTRNLESRTLPSGERYYLAGDGNEYPSVTTRLKWHYGEKWKEKWINRVGQEHADTVSGMARSRGSEVHLLAERYINNEQNWAHGSMPINVDIFERIKSHLDCHLKLVYGLEYPLWSPTLKTAGRADLIGRWKGLDSVIDFKTATHAKPREMIESYFIQAACYAMMTEELIGLNIPRIVIVLSPEHDVTARVFEDWTCEWRSKVRSIFV